MSLLNSMLIAVGALFTSSALAAPSLPAPDRNGDYMGPARSWYLWQVADADPAGLNCRATPEFANGTWLDDVDSLRSDIQNFPVVKRLLPSTVIFTNIAPAGIALWMDDAGKPWVRVSLSEESDAMCFVRANSKYVKPVRSSLQ